MSVITPEPSVIRFLVPPSDAGLQHRVDGGRIMEWVDKAGYAAAGRWAGSYCMSVYMGDVWFGEAITPGELVEIESTIVQVGRTSIRVQAVVRACDPIDPTFVLRARCEIVYVAVDDEGRARAVPPWQPADSGDASGARHDEDTTGAAEERRMLESGIVALAFDSGSAAPTTTLRVLAAPSDVNWAGRVHGGVVMRWMDQAAHVCAAGWLRAPARAVYATGVRFTRPIRIGDVVEVEARLVHTGATMMAFAVRTASADPTVGAFSFSTESLWLYSSVAETTTGKTAGVSAIPVWTPHTASESEADERIGRLEALNGLSSAS